MDRRTFLAGAAALPFLRPIGAAPKSLGLLMGAGVRRDPITARPLFTWELIDLDTRARRSVATDFYGHGFIQDPKNPRRAYLFEKKGGGSACEVDLKEARVVTSISPASGCAFYGHGAFSRDGSVFFATESTIATKIGKITIRDGKSAQVLGECPSFGMGPHDCTLIEQGKVLAITNGGGDFLSQDLPCVTYVDVASQRLLDKVVLTNSRLNAGHLALSKKGALVVVSAPRDGLATEERGGLSWRPAGDSSTHLHSLDVPEARAMVGETLSVTISEGGRLVGTTNPIAGRLDFWDLDGMALRKSFYLENARGITLSLDGGSFLVSHGAKPLVSAFDARTLARVDAGALDDVRIAGSHLFVIPKLER